MYLLNANASIAYAELLFCSFMNFYYFFAPTLLTHVGIKFPIIPFVFWIQLAGDLYNADYFGRV